jgi:hypothetical protein
MRKLLLALMVAGSVLASAVGPALAGSVTPPGTEACRNIEPNHIPREAAISGVVSADPCP